MSMEEKIKKLPKWAQEHIKELTMRRESAVRQLNEYCDDQTESPFRTEDFVCTGEGQGPSLKKRYIQAHHMVVSHSDVHLDIYLRDDTIQLQWSAENRGLKDVAMIPESFQCVRLVSHENMRN